MKKQRSNDIISPKVHIHSGTPPPSSFLRLPITSTDKTLFNNDNSNYTTTFRNYADRKAAAGAGKAMVSMLKTQPQRKSGGHKPPGKTAKNKTPRKFPYRKTTDIEEEIFARETQIMAWNDDLQRPEVVRDSERVRQIHQEIQAEQETIKQLYEHWEEASERNG